MLSKYANDIITAVSKLPEVQKSVMRAMMSGCERGTDLWEFLEEDSAMFPGEVNILLWGRSNLQDDIQDQDIICLYHCAESPNDICCQLIDQVEASISQTITLVTEEWKDGRDELAGAIQASHPVRSHDHDRYQKARELINTRHSKGSLLGLVNHLLPPTGSENFSLTPDELYSVFAAMCAMVEDIHAPQDQMDEAKWVSARNVFKRIEAKLNGK